MTKLKLAIFFTIVILISLGYCGYAGGQAKWGLWALGAFILSCAGLFVVAMFAFFDWMIGRGNQ